MPEARRSEGEWVETTLGEMTAEQNLRVGSSGPAPVVLSSTKHYGLVPSDEYFKNRTIYSDDLANYKRVLRDWFAYATNHLAEGSIGRQKRFDDSCVSPIYTVFSCADGVHPPYLERVVKSVPLVEQYKTHEQATVDRRGAVRYRDFARVRVNLPPVIEQVKIAEVLDTLDTTIRQTEAIIEKLKQVKQGLLHDLLTRGIDANGELRPPQSHAPHLYKDSPLGWIPREWKAVRFADAGTVTLGRQSAPRYQRGVNTRPYLRVVNILEDRLDLRDVKTMDFDPTDFQRFCLRPGDVLLTEGDLASAHTVGRSAVYGGEVDGCCFQNTLIRFRPAQPEHSDYFHFAFCHLRATGRFAAVTTATTVHHLSAGRLEREVFLPLAPAPERLEVARRLRAIEHLVDVESRGLGKHAVLKSGLMDDLLTGRIRVTPLLA